MNNINNIHFKNKERKITVIVQEEDDPFLLGIFFILLHMAELRPPHRGTCSLDKQVG